MSMGKSQILTSSLGADWCLQQLMVCVTSRADGRVIFEDGCESPLCAAKHHSPSLGCLSSVIKICDLSGEVGK